MHSAQVDNYGPEVMSRLSKILPGVTSACCMPQHSQGALNITSNDHGACNLGKVPSIETRSSALFRSGSRGLSDVLWLSCAGSKGRQPSLDSMPDDILHLIFNAAQLHTAAGAHEAQPIMFTILGSETRVSALSAEGHS